MKKDVVAEEVKPERTSRLACYFCQVSRVQILDVQHAQNATDRRLPHPSLVNRTAMLSETCAHLLLIRRLPCRDRVVIADLL